MWQLVAVLTATETTAEAVGGSFSNIRADGGIWVKAESPEALRRFAYGVVGVVLSTGERCFPSGNFYPAGGPQLFRVPTGPLGTVSGRVIFIPRTYSRRRMGQGAPAMTWPVAVEIWAESGGVLPEVAPTGFAEGQDALGPVGARIGPLGAMRLSKIG